MSRLRLSAAVLFGLAAASPALAQQTNMTDVPPPPASLIQPAAANRGVPVAKLNAAQRATLGRISDYVNSIQTMVANFTQVGPDGRRTNGTLYLDKPGKIRFQYAAPSQLEIISDGDSVAVRNRKLNTQDLYPLSQTPLRFLLQKRIDLLQDANVIGVFQDPEIVSVILEEKRAIGGKSQLQLMFGGADYKLQSWTVTDARGGETTVALDSIDTARKPDPRVFRINRQGVVRGGPR
ncbi:outer-membrane lipoprotein carrier protein [Methylopila jiangsuensis]|uniref:Outer-membrane lipoprotein carrier protein n=1 Tax=Methylopila jiangsuensis TaxID=586230 RepID=A0A9W6JCE9_9HYPH|nr:outer-membrane lipoprotein carrier protein LolA [Methylopila jiangsuensis]MDR6287419.1 outer membrane lipoprotein-sorting protein [Methylopila jiangsuensis]GLK75000.1 outer-membrane lipoprotein carrier protein [Methylopila jiangsuensis]